MDQDEETATAQEVTLIYLSMNALRRQMNDGQKAMSAARYAAAKKDESRARQLAHLKHQPSLAPIGANDESDSTFESVVA